MTDRTPDPTIHYIHRLSYTQKERVVGFFIVIGAGVLLALLFFSSGMRDLFEPRFDLVFYVQNAQGVTQEGKVMMSGIEVGNIGSIEPTENNQIKVVMQVFERYQRWIYRDASAALRRLSVLGNASIEIVPGSAVSGMIIGGSTIPVKNQAVLEDMIATAVPALMELQKTLVSLNSIIRPEGLQGLSGIVEDTAKAMSRLERLTALIVIDDEASVEAFRLRLSAMMSSMERVLTEGEQRMLELKPLTRFSAVLAEQGEPVIKDIRGMIGGMQQTVGTLHHQLDDVGAQMTNYPDMLLRVNLLMEQFERVLTAIETSWPLDGVVKKPSTQTLIKGTADE
ncbi:MAG: MCE family protein [Gammaproteobacteria bacterium]|nr:MCE family protein [Gammaproteobacteria bacterium]